MSLEEYTKKELKQQILDEPDTFVGGIDKIEDYLPIFNNDKIKIKNIKYNPAIPKLFDEIFVNARDQKIRLDESKEKNIIPVTIIKVEYDKENKMWSIYNNGNGIDVAEHPTETDENGDFTEFDKRCY